MRDLLQHIAERTIHGRAQELTEQQIGEVLFHKPAGYSPLDDSSVRVHVRQLRLKLHEYFDQEGRNETLILEIPKGSYAPTFRAGTPRQVPALEIAQVPTENSRRLNRALIPWMLCAILAVSCAVLLTKQNNRIIGDTPAKLAWPFSQIFDKRHQTIMVVADSNYGMWRILSGQPGSLDRYLRREFMQSPLKLGGSETPFSEYVSNSTLTSFADVTDLVSLLKMAGPLQSQVSVRYPRDLRTRDLDHDNFIFIGSPASNPWVSLFLDKLNFRESEATVGKSVKAFVNTHPQPGEQERYEGLRWTGTGGEDYATIALLPNPTHDGSMLILQGLQQEGSEAAGRFLADDESRHQLQTALGIDPAKDGAQEIWFEALVRSRTVSGAPSSTSLVAVRRIH